MIVKCIDYTSSIVVIVLQSQRIWSFRLTIYMIFHLQILIAFFLQSDSTLYIPHPWHYTILSYEDKQLILCFITYIFYTYMNKYILRCNKFIGSILQLTTQFPKFLQISIHNLIATQIDINVDLFSLKIIILNLYNSFINNVIFEDQLWLHSATTMNFYSVCLVYLGLCSKNGTINVESWLWESKLLKPTFFTWRVESSSINKTLTN